MNQVTIKAGEVGDIDLGNSRAMTIAATGGTAKVYVEYRRDNGPWSSAFRVDSGLRAPLQVSEGRPVTLEKRQLSSEHLRVSSADANIIVQF